MQLSRREGKYIIWYTIPDYSVIGNDIFKPVSRHSTFDKAWDAAEIGQSIRCEKTQSSQLKRG